MGTIMVITPDLIPVGVTAEMDEEIMIDKEVVAEICSKRASIMASVMVFRTLEAGASLEILRAPA
jgi:hypothetical protein